MSKPKQVIVVRGDLVKLLRFEGKLAAQVSHASLGAVFKNSKVMEFDGGKMKCIPMDEDCEKWFNVEFTKIVVKCVDEQHILDLYSKVEQSGIPYYSLIKDAGHTVFSEPTITCLGIGPASAEEIDAITGGLPLL